MNRDPVFDKLDAMIFFGWGDTPQTKIPENWRDIPREVNQHDLARIRAEQTLPEADRIRAIEVNYTLAERVMEQEMERQRANRELGRRRKPGSGHPRGKSNKPWPLRVEWRQAAMRARRSA